MLISITELYLRLKANILGVLYTNPDITVNVNTALFAKTKPCEMILVNHKIPKNQKPL